MPTSTLLGARERAVSLFARFCAQVSMSEVPEMHMPVKPPTKNGPIKVEFVCDDCKHGKHGCVGLWKGLGLEIRCSCNGVSCGVKTNIARESPRSSTRKGVMEAQ